MPKVLATIWEKASGYKTIAGLTITLLAFLAQWVPDALAAGNVDPVLAGKISGALITVFGLAHKAFKLLYSEAK